MEVRSQRYAFRVGFWSGLAGNFTVDVRTNLLGEYVSTSSLNIRPYAYYYLFL